MLISMTGHGDGQHRANGRTVEVEIRSVNSRFFKLVVRGSDSYAQLESQVESLIRRRIRRGTISLAVKISREISAADFRLNAAVLDSYQQQVTDVLGKERSQSIVNSGVLLRLPGVVVEPTISNQHLESDWSAVEPAVTMALESLEKMRRQEGAAMARDLAENCSVIAQHLQSIEKRAPTIVDAFQNRLVERLKVLLAENDVTVNPNDVIREVGIYSERCDISEETVRLQNHLVHFGKITEEPESAGRKLDFLVQEMLRETNTIGSKCNDAQVAKDVIEIKTAIERMREMIQNVE